MEKHIYLKPTDSLSTCRSKVKCHKIDHLQGNGQANGQWVEEGEEHSPGKHICVMRAVCVLDASQTSRRKLFIKHFRHLGNGMLQDAVPRDDRHIDGHQISYKPPFPCTAATHVCVCVSVCPVLCWTNKRVISTTSSVTDGKPFCALQKPTPLSDLMMPLVSCYLPERKYELKRKCETRKFGQATMVDDVV